LSKIAQPQNLQSFFCDETLKHFLKITQISQIHPNSPHVTPNPYWGSTPHKNSKYSKKILGVGETAAKAQPRSPRGPAQNTVNSTQIPGVYYSSTTSI